MERNGPLTGIPRENSVRASGFHWNGNFCRLYRINMVVRSNRSAPFQKGWNDAPSLLDIDPQPFQTVER